MTGLVIRSGLIYHPIQNLFLNAKQKMYSADDGNTEVFYFKDATAVFSSFAHEPEVEHF